MGESRGQALGERSGMMHAAPSRFAEALVAVVLPPACREEVLGDLHERYRSPWQYASDALLTAPLVVWSRIRRTADAQVLLIQAFALYLSFLGAAEWTDAALLHEQWGMVKLAIPAAMFLLGSVLEDAYACPGRRSLLALVRGPLVGLGMALLSQGVVRAGSSDLLIPGRVLISGCGMSLLLASAVRMLFAPFAGSLKGAAGPALWLKRAAGTDGSLEVWVRILQGVVAVLGCLIIGYLAFCLRSWKRG